MRLLSQGLVAPTQRTIPDFDLRRPLTVDEAVAAGAAGSAAYAQGCTDLFAQFREGLRCTTLVSLDKITGLRAISYDGGTLRIGAGAVHHEGARHPAVRTALPGLAAAWRQIATHRIRQRATIGGNIMARRPRYEMPVMCDSLGAELSFISPNGPCRLSTADVWDSRVPPGALLLSVDLPDLPGAWFGYERSLRPLLTVAATARADTAGGGMVRVSVGSEMRRHFTVEAPLGTDPMDIAAALPGEIGDAVAGARYRRHAAGVLLGRLLARRASERTSEEESR
ncbi:MAG TPA: FAD binding domain-containing protein [Trebonia sp.]